MSFRLQKTYSGFGDSYFKIHILNPPLGSQHISKALKMILNFYQLPLSPILVCCHRKLVSFSDTKEIYLHHFYYNCSSEKKHFRGGKELLWVKNISSDLYFGSRLPVSWLLIRRIFQLKFFLDLNKQPCNT